MTRFEGVAILVAAALAGLLPLLRRRRPDGPRSRAARIWLWLALASPIPFLVLPPLSRPCVFVSGPRGYFEATRLLSLAAAASSLVLTALERSPRLTSPRRAWGVTGWVLLTSVAGLLAATALVL